MSNVEKGRFYWLKLKEDFFEDDAIEWLEEQKNGKEYALFYLKLCLKSLKSNGTLIRRVGTMLVPYDTEKLAEITKTDFDTVVVAMQLLKQIGLIEVLDTGEIYISSLSDMVGSEVRSAERVRLHRERKKALQCNNNVTACNEHCNREIELEKEIELDIDKEIERDAEAAEPLPTALSAKNEKKEKPKKHRYGEYKNVLLTDDEHGKLAELFPDLEERIERLSGYIASTGKTYKSHYATIRNWAKHDAVPYSGYSGSYIGQAETVTVNGKQYEKRGGKYYIPGGSGIAVDPYDSDADSLFR